MQLSDLDARVHPQAPENFHGFVGASPQTLEIFNEVRIAASTDWPVLILGETGTGKELLARAVHDYSDRRDRPYVAINCGSLTPQLAASELFGHVKGAFTGALQDREGAFQRAKGGTLFLDEVGDLPPETQAALLRVLETGQFRPLGSDRPVAANVRYVAATHHALEDAKAFRLDLFHRLDGWTVRVPPLRHRPSDIVPIAQALLRSLAPQASFDPGALSALTDFHWPGNVRQLRNVVRRASRLAHGRKVTVEHLRLDRPLRPVDVTRRVLRSALEANQGNLTATASALGISMRTFRRRLEAASLDVRTERRRAKMLVYRNDLVQLAEVGSRGRLAHERGITYQAISARFQRAERILASLFREHHDMAEVAARLGLQPHEFEDLLRIRSNAMKVTGRKFHAA